MAKVYTWLTLFMITCCIQVNSAALPFFWSLLFAATTISSSVTSATVNSSDVGNYSETYNGNNNNVQSYPVTFIQNGSPVDKSSVVTIDQYLGNVKVNVSKRSIPQFAIEPAVFDYHQQHIEELGQYIQEFGNFIA